MIRKFEINAIGDSITKCKNSNCNVGGLSCVTKCNFFNSRRISKLEVSCKIQDENDKKSKYIINEPIDNFAFGPFLKSKIKEDKKQEEDNLKNLIKMSICYYTGDKFSDVVVDDEFLKKIQAMIECIDEINKK